LKYNGLVEKVKKNVKISHYFLVYQLQVITFGLLKRTFRLNRDGKGDK